VLAAPAPVAGARRPARILAAFVGVIVPVVLLAVLLLRPQADGSWESHPAHFWLVLSAAASSVVLGVAVSTAARSRRDARLFLVSLGFLASASFLGLHALATPGVLLGKNAGFELATPVGLVIASAFAAASALEWGREGGEYIIRAAPLLLGLLVGIVVAWAVVSLAELPPLDKTLGTEQLDGWQISLAAVGVALYAFAALGYLHLYRRRRARFLLAVSVAFALLAESMIVIAWARNWHASWWEWHLLMLAAFLVIAETARTEWHEERFSALYLDETLAGARDVTVLLADLSGFTSYSEQHTPSEVTAMLNAYLGELVPLVEREGGEVHQIVGDELFAIFNKQGDTPDHPLRAARAAVRLLDRADEIARDGWPRFRVGVNTGEVVAAVVGGASGHRKHSVVGDAVNVAARLETAADPGTALIGGATFRRLPPGVVTERIGHVPVKGKTEPVEAYRLHAVGTQARMSDEQSTPREDDKNDEIDESPVPDPEKNGDSRDDPEAD
jgi:class 3 adenylate cyclase